MESIDAEFGGSLLKVVLEDRSLVEHVIRVFQILDVMSVGKVTSKCLVAGRSLGVHEVDKRVQPGHHCVDQLGRWASSSP